MITKLVDILGFLQPDSGNNWSEGLKLSENVKILYLFEQRDDANITLFYYYNNETILKILILSELNRGSLVKDCFAARIHGKSGSQGRM